MAQPLSKEKEEVELMMSWMEAGGFPAQQEEEAKGLLSEVGSSSFPPSPFLFLLSNWHYIFLYNSCILSCLFSEVRLTTESKLTKGGGAKAGRESTAVRNRGVGKNEGSCGRVRGRRSLWTLEGSYITLPPSPISTSF